MLQCFLGRFSAVLLLVIVKGANAECPLKINPPRLVVRFNSLALANCSASVTPQGMGWESTIGAVPLSTDSLITWRVPQLRDWEIQPPQCYINYDKQQCQVELPVTIYNKPQHSRSTEEISQSNYVYLNCTVKANPAAVYTWHSEHLTEKINSSVIQSSTLSPGKYTCTATNDQGADSIVFIVSSAGWTTIWAIVIAAVVLAVLLAVICIVIFKIKSRQNFVVQ